MTTCTDPLELQALIKYHAECIAEHAADDGITPELTPKLILTIQRMLVLAQELERCPAVEA